MPKGHEKDSSKTSQSNSIDLVKDGREVTNILNILDNTSIRTNPFGANITGDNSYRRAERISAVLHLITNHVPDDEPLRTLIRSGGLDLLDQILELRTGFRTPASEKGQATLAAIRALVSRVRLLAIAGYISLQNANAVTEALDELGSLLTVAQRSALSEQVSISREDLTPPAREHVVQKVERTAISTRAHRPREQRPVEKVEAAVKDSGSARSEQIMDILKHGGVLGIKDITANLPQYSEKMVQRELAILVSSGRVQKTGEKRWSRYKAL